MKTKRSINHNVLLVGDGRDKESLDLGLELNFQVQDHLWSLPKTRLLLTSCYGFGSLFISIFGLVSAPILKSDSKKLSRQSSLKITSDVLKKKR